MTANRVARHDIQARSFKFACQIVFFCKSLANSTTAPWILVNQLLDSGTSIGANLEEAVAASSRRDFVAKCRVALKEARETLFGYACSTRVASLRRWRYGRSWARLTPTSPF